MARLEESIDEQLMLIEPLFGNTNEIQAIGSTGGNQAHSNQQPYQAVNFIICLQGVFPPRS